MENEQNDRMKVVDKRRFRFDNSGEIEEQTDILAEVSAEKKAQRDAQATAAATPAPTANQQPTATAGPQPAQPQPQPPASAGADAPQPQPAPQEEAPPQREGMPVMDFVRQQAYLAMIYLGQQPNPGTGLVQQQPEGVREIVDILLMLRSVSVGNLAPDEHAAIDDLVRQLQMAYLQIANAAPPPPPPNL